MVDLLAEVGVPAEADSRRADFLGLKISKCAMYSTGGKCMYHATLLYKTNLQMLASALQETCRFSRMGCRTSGSLCTFGAKSGHQYCIICHQPCNYKIFKNIIISFFTEKEDCRRRISVQPVRLAGNQSAKRGKICQHSGTFKLPRLKSEAITIYM